MEIDENGVVNPLRPPRIVAAAGARIAGLPPLALGFVVLALIDLVIGVARVRAPSLTLADEVLVILLPVAVLWRRRDAAVATPGVLWGTMLVAIGAVGSRFVGSIDALLVNADVPEAALNGGSPLTFIRIVAVTALDVAGWALVARSIARLRPAGSALLRGVGLVVVLAAVVAQSLSFGFALGPGSVGLNVVILVENLALAAATAAIAWVFITRSGGRPPIATASAAIGAATSVTASTPLIVIATAFAGSHDENLLALQAPAIWLVAIGGLFTSVLLLVAFATGLADPPPAAEDPQPGILR